jgi:hypothetical protein
MAGNNSKLSRKSWENLVRKTRGRFSPEGSNSFNNFDTTFTKTKPLDADVQELWLLLEILPESEVRSTSWHVLAGACPDPDLLSRIPIRIQTAVS